MSDVVGEPLGAGRIEPRELEQEMRSSYLDYAMSVIVGRALPDVRDGLKPVHRRVLWGMHDAGHQPNRPYVKCARVTGDVMGKYHPHDSSSIYDALARLVQPFSLRYPLVDGQGNFGSIDDDPPAAERYTECRLAKLATEMLRDIDSDTVNFGPNYDESRREPQVLPARFPNLLVNGSTGIAVGMATNIPPHNLSETIDAVIELIDKPTASADDLMKHVKGPDFPTGAIVVGRSGIRDAYRTGRGRIVMRARAHVEELRGGKSAIIVTELPYGVKKGGDGGVIAKIADLVREKVITEVSDLQDYSDKTGMRIQIELKREAIPQVALTSKIGSIALDRTPNSAAVHEGLLAVAIEADPRTDPGTAAFYSTSCDPTVPGGCTPLNEVEVGALPDMVTFSPSGQYTLVANEGEPEGEADPKGTVSIIDLRKGVSQLVVSTVDFTSLDGGPVPAGAILQSGKLPSVDFEPEYVTVSKNSRTAWVSLQEANAIAEVDIRKAKLEAVHGLGFKNLGQAQNSFDASDRDNAINMCAWANVNGMYQPDAIAAYQVQGKHFILSANEGDSRAADESRVGALPAASFDATFPASIRNNPNLGRLTVNKSLGQVTGIYKQLFVYGARSFSIWDETGTQVYDSANQLERIIAPFPSATPSPLRATGPDVPPAPASTCPVTGPLPTSPALTTPFNANSEEGPSFDTRSDNKGPESEGAVLGKLHGQTYAFIGLERAGGIMVYNVENPNAPVFVEYVNPRNFAAEYELPDEPGEWEEAGDLGPEGLAFIPAGASPNSVPLLVVANEVSGTTTIYEIVLG